MGYYNDTLSPKHINLTKNIVPGPSHLFDMFLGSRDKSQMTNLSPPRNYSPEGGLYGLCWVVQREACMGPVGWSGGKHAWALLGGPEGAMQGPCWVVQREACMGPLRRMWSLMPPGRESLQVVFEEFD